jgi:hypothetical protein
MKQSCCFSFLWLLVLLAGDALADFTGKGHVHTLSSTRQEFLNHECLVSKACGLKRFTVTKSVEEVWFSDDPNHPTYGSGVTMEYETDSVATLERFAVVQFVKGCVFYSSKNGRGKITRTVIDTVTSFGEQVPFCFPDWVIDSQDTDPAYNSDPEQGRFHLLRWNKPGSYDQRTQKFYGTEKPKSPVVYITDYPAGAFVGITAVKNTALAFKSCIYKAVDVPSDTRRHNTVFADAIACFEWQSIYIYDFDRGVFQTSLRDFPHRAEPDTGTSLYMLVALIAGVLALIAWLSIKGYRRG